MTPILDHALFYAQKGWAVFPLRPRDKMPTVKWADVCTTETNMITGWWEFQPDSNLGIATGSKSGITVLDVDADHEGYESLAELLIQYGALPETPIAKTGGGGEHIFFKFVPGTRNSAGKLGLGLDIRSEGGYVVGAGSTHPNGKRYEWVVKPSQVDLADMPEWMIEKLQERNQENPISTTGNIINGERNNVLTSIAGSMRRKGLGEDAIFSALSIHNREHCNPVLPEGEVLQIAKSVGRYAPSDEIKIQPIKVTQTVYEVLDSLEEDIRERQRNPKEVWGIHYAWPYLSIITGGKQKGELIILAGEPKVGKSWWAHQDYLYSALGMDNIESTPSLIWSGEMRKKQVYRRFFEMMGIPKRHMLSGQMSENDWQFFTDAKAIIMNSPIYVSDAPLDLKDVRGMLEKEIGEHGIEQVLFDYDWLISSPGKDEIQQSQNTSRELKQLAHELNISIMLVSSVNKMGMDSASENVTKTNVSGSGKKLHDADVIYILTKFNEKKNQDLAISARDYEKIVTLHIAAAREMDYHVPNGAINYMRETPNPKFKELKNIAKPGALPGWMTNRKDLE